MSKWLMLAVPLFTGCTWLSARSRDLGDIVKVEGSIGVGLQANVTATELLHLGAGSSRRHTAGWAYGFPIAEERDEDHLPLSLITLATSENDALHTLRIGPEKDNRVHRCKIVAPASFEAGNIRKPAMQFWSVEVGVMALVVGAEVGLNVAEVADFILGLFGVDIGEDDDPDERARRRLWIPATLELSGR